MESIILNSVSKINLGLNILRKRDDGYHDLETIFYPVDLCDTFSFRKSSSFSFISDSRQLVNDESNLIIKAKNLVERITGEKINAEIKLNKFIPFGAGLGGGSSNAATTLKGLNMLYQFGLNEETLLKAALELGSDVPFFIKSVPCFATSRGEVMEEADLKINYPVLIVNPGVHVSTRWAFENVKPHKPEYDLRSFLTKKVPVEKFSDFIFNDFEEVVFRELPVVKEVKEFFYNSGALFALMSGSGSTVYGIFGSLQDAEKTRDKFVNKKYLTHIHYENF